MKHYIEECRDWFNVIGENKEDMWERIWSEDLNEKKEELLVRIWKAKEKLKRGRREDRNLEERRLGGR